MFEYNKKIINKYDFLELDSKRNKIKNDFDFHDLELNDNDRLSNPVFKSIGYPSKIYYKNWSYVNILDTKSQTFFIIHF